MTVVITYKTDTDGILIVDREMGGINSKYDSLGKYDIIKKNDFTAVLTGAGDGKTLFNIRKSMKNIDAKTLEELSKLTKGSLSFMKESEGEAYFKYETDKLNKQLTITPKNKKKEVEWNESKRIMQEYEENTTDTNFILMGYDKTNNAMRRFLIGHETVEENDIEINSIGSGYAGVEAYNSMYLHGLTGKLLKLNEQLFHGLNSYHFACRNTGVGGKPDIIILDKNEIFELPRRETIILYNLSSIYVSRYNEGKISTKEIINSFEKIINKEEINLEQIGQKVNINPTNIESLLLTPLSFVERINGKYDKNIGIK